MHESAWLLLFVATLLFRTRAGLLAASGFRPFLRAASLACGRLWGSAFLLGTARVGRLGAAAGSGTLGGRAGRTAGSAFFLCDVLDEVLGRLDAQTPEVVVTAFLSQPVLDGLGHFSSLQSEMPLV